MYVYDDDDIYLSVCGIHITTTMLLLQLQYVMCLLFSAVQYYVIKSYFLVVVFFGQGKAAAEPYVQQYIYSHTFTEYNIIVVVVYRICMYVVLLQERWYTSIYGLGWWSSFILLHSFSLLRSRSPCVMLYVVHFLIYHLAQIHFT